MHELSIARTLVHLANEHRPAGCALEQIRVQVGPLQAIDVEAMQFAWQAASQDTNLAHATLELILLPWRLQCPDCGRQWEAESWDTPCQCGSERNRIVGGDELLLDSLEVAPRHDHRQQNDGATAQTLHSENS